MTAETATVDEGIEWESVPLREIRAYLERVKFWMTVSCDPASERIEEVDPMAIVGGGKALLPRDLQERLWGEARYPRPSKWFRLLEARKKGIRVPPIVVFSTPEGMICRDGNHRLLLARLLGAPTIRARVFETCRHSSSLSMEER